MKIYKEKGPLPCNYWEIQFQLSEDRKAISRAGELFFVERQNLFDLEYDTFRDSIQSENGLITWYLLSLLPIHFIYCSDRDRAVHYLRRLFYEGTSMERYVAGFSIYNITRKKDFCTKLLDKLVDDVGNFYISNPEYLFLYPRPICGPSNLKMAVGFIQSQVHGVRKLNPYAIPWMRLLGDSLHRFYINGGILRYEMIQVERDEKEYLEDLIQVLVQNQEKCILNFGGDSTEEYRFVVMFLIESLGFAAIVGYVNVALQTIRKIIEKYIEQEQDPANSSVFCFAIKHTLQSIKEYHRDQVLSFIDRYDLNNSKYQFLADLKTSAIEKEKYFTQSHYFNTVYQETFLGSKNVHEAFGRITQKAAKAKTVEDFFYIYVSSFMEWLNELPVK